MHNNLLLPQKKYTLTAGCKVNLSLKIKNILPNGWHELDSLFIPISKPHDELIITIKTETKGLTVHCDTPGIDPQNNTLTKAYQYYTEFSSFSPPLLIHLKKGIPHGSGLGGGSSDAAVFLLWLQKNSPSPLPIEKLYSIAAKVGADTPFFLKNTPCRVTGIGEKLKPIALTTLPINKNYLVLILPDIHISTPWAYKNWDTWFFSQNKSSNTQPLLTKKSLQVRSSTPNLHKNIFWLKNNFETSIFSAYPILRKYKQQLLLSGARAAALSGSGSSLWGLFTDNTTASSTVKMFQNQNVNAICHML